MRDIFRSLINSIREDFGTPVALTMALAEHPDLRVDMKPLKRVIALHRVPHWHRWHQDGEEGVVSLWYWRDYRYTRQQIRLPALAEVVRCRTLDDWACEIQDVEGFSSSKSKLEDFETMDAMVERNSLNMIDELSERKLQENLAHHEIRILRKVNKVDSFERHQWDGRVFLRNSGGSHHFAAARYIARRIGREVPLNGPLDDYHVDLGAVEQLRREFDMYAVAADSVPFMALHDALERFRATFGIYHLPRPLVGRMILLPKDEDRSARVSTTLRQARFVDLGAHPSSMGMANQ